MVFTVIYSPVHPASIYHIATCTVSIEVIYIIITLSCQLEILENVIQYTKAQAEQTVILKMGLEANTISMHIVHIAIILKKIGTYLSP